MIPSANSTGDLSAWHTDSWADHAGAAAAVETAYNSSVTSSSAAPAADHSRYLALHRHQILDWENAMLLASHHSNATNDHSVYDHVAPDYTKAAGISPMHADALSSLSHSRHYEELLSAHMASSANSASFNNNNAWGLLNNVCSRSAGNTLQQEASLLQTAGAQYSGYDQSQLTVSDGLGGYAGGLGTGAAAGLYADSLRSSSSNSVGLNSFDQRRLDDIMKRELYTTHDFNSRLGLNLGGRTYFSADDFAFGRWGKRLRPNSPGCMMQPAPLCQAEGCKADLSMAKHYHRRHKVCEYHSKAATVHIGDQTQRFCQQCSRFHVLDEFDDGKRSCRKRLADHNRRRRKPQPTPANAAAEATTTEAGGDNSTDQQTNKEPSQDATTGSDSHQTGTQSRKGSPLPGAEDQPKPAAASEMANHSEASSGNKSVNEQEKLQKREQSKAATTASTKGPLSVSGNHHRMDVAIASPKTSNLAATLSLGGATDIMDVKPASHMMPANLIDAHDGSPFEDSLRTSSKHAVVMPWLQGSKKHHNMQGLPFDENTRTVANEGSDRPQYARFKTAPSVDFKESNNTRGSWVTKGLAGATADSDTDALLLNPRYAGGSKSGGSEAGSSIGTLAFLDQSLDQSAFARSDQHRMLHFSNLQGSDAEQQAAMTLNHGRIEDVCRRRKRSLGGAAPISNSAVALSIQSLRHFFLVFMGTA
ncbi:hypothetical protein GOP47_0001439 [Adiantum capillus-veneris]|uniref:SBP-type domain-containing protein n=1 Tax=Adiantum capillus-veneris TaxID=13818 RepID=A0A9D4V9I7_ADICA|nr:hypothetical protein GOP47_0001439 [Adiantum capillus-veneris]